MATSPRYELGPAVQSGPRASGGCPGGRFPPATGQVAVHRIVHTALFLLEMCFIFSIK